MTMTPNGEDAAPPDCHGGRWVRDYNFYKNVFEVVWDPETLGAFAPLNSALQGASTWRWEPFEVWQDHWSQDEMAANAREWVWSNGAPVPQSPSAWRSWSVSPGVSARTVPGVTEPLLPPVVAADESVPRQAHVAGIADLEEYKQRKRLRQRREARWDPPC